MKMYPVYKQMEMQEEGSYTSSQLHPGRVVTANITLFLSIHGSYQHRTAMVCLFTWLEFSQVNDSEERRITTGQENRNITIIQAGQLLSRPARRHSFRGRAI